MSKPLPILAKRYARLIAKSIVTMDKKPIEGIQRRGTLAFDNLADGILNYHRRPNDPIGSEYAIYSLIHYRTRQPFEAADILDSMNLPYDRKMGKEAKQKKPYLTQAMHFGELDFGNAAILCMTHPKPEGIVMNILEPRHLTLISMAGSLEATVEAQARAMEHVFERSTFGIGLCKQAWGIPNDTYGALSRFYKSSGKAHSKLGIEKFAGQVEIMDGSAPYDIFSGPEVDFPFDFRYPGLDSVKLKLYVFKINKSLKEPMFGMRYKTDFYFAQFVFEGYEKDSNIPKVKASFLYDHYDVPSPTPLKFLRKAQDVAMQLSKMIHKPVYIQHYQGSELLEKRKF